MLIPEGKYMLMTSKCINWIFPEIGELEISTTAKIFS